MQVMTKCLNFVNKWIMKMKVKLEYPQINRFKQ